jgi:tetratricopeptide (TPR) repeat protein
MAKKIVKTDENLVAIEEALSKTERFIEDNKNKLMYILGAIVAIILIMISINRYVLVPREKNAHAQMFVAEQYFEKDSLDLALNGDGNYPGFLEIIDSYKWTKQANLAHYYAGVIYLKKGEFEEALTHLKKFKGKDKVVATMAKGCIGDAYMELGDNKQALKYYLKAANEDKNDFLTPVFLMKLAQTYEILGQYKDALEQYRIIQREYPQSNESREIEKYIGRIEALAV